MRFRSLFLFCLLLTLASCAKKEVMLPVIAADGIGQTENHSSIWIFFEVSGQDTLAVLNKANKMLNTHWIFNIDRRLSMKEVIPVLQTMQQDRNKDSMHKKEGMKNYFSFADSKNQRISLVDFPPIDFVRSDEFDHRGAMTSDSTCVIGLTLLGENCRIGDRDYVIEDVDRIAEALKGCPDGKQGSFRLIYSENLGFQEYLAARAHLASASLPLDSTEIVQSSK